ncbi:unnamed protein product [Eretmochelys imbricata]
MPLTSSSGDSAEDPPSESGRADFRGGDRNEANGQLFSALSSRVVPGDTAVGEGSLTSRCNHLSFPVFLHNFYTMTTSIYNLSHLKKVCLTQHPKADHTWSLKKFVLRSKYCSWPLSQLLEELYLKNFKLRNIRSEPYSPGPSLVILKTEKRNSRM